MSPDSPSSMAQLTGLESVWFLGDWVYVRVVAMVREWAPELILRGCLSSTLLEVSARDSLQPSKIAFNDILLLCSWGPDGAGYDEIAFVSTHWTGLACLLAFGMVIVVVIRSGGTPASNTLCKFQMSKSSWEENIPRQKAWSQLTRRP